MEASQHRLRARESLRGNWLIAVLVALVAGLLGASGNNFEWRIDLDSSFAEFRTLFQASDPESFLRLLALMVYGLVTSAISGVFFIAALILGGVMELGSARYNLNLIDRQKAGFSDLFSQFSRFAQALVMKLLTSLFIILWSMLLVIPGIVASYRYAMAPYILLEDPECSGYDAIQRSKEMMMGHKWELFCLDLSFIGWAILCAFTFGIGNLFLNPYTAASRASFYRSLSGYDRDSARRCNPEF